MRERGIASWYGKQFHGKKTSNGEVFDMYSVSAAHKTMELPSYARVTNLENGRSMIIRINDRCCCGNCRASADGRSDTNQCRNISRYMHNFM